MKIAVLGARGMLGSDVVEVLGRTDHEVIGCGRGECDVTAGPYLIRKMGEARPDWVINCAAYTDVDGAEKHPEEAFRVNRDGAATVAIGARGIAARLIHLSTDYVFDGEQYTPYREDDAPNPLGIYGISKGEGEQEVLRIHDRSIVIRTAWTYGDHRTNFVEKMISRAAWKREVRVVSDQHGSPTYTLDVATKILEMIEADVEPGIYHVTNSGVCSRAEEARRIIELAGIEDVKITEVPSSDFPSPAKRPKNSVLENVWGNFVPMAEQALKLHLKWTGVSTQRSPADMELELMGMLADAWPEHVFKLVYRPARDALSAHERNELRLPEDHRAIFLDAHQIFVANEALDIVKRKDWRREHISLLSEPPRSCTMTEPRGGLRQPDGSPDPEPDSPVVRGVISAFSEDPWTAFLNQWAKCILSAFERHFCRRDSKCCKSCEAHSTAKTHLDSKAETCQAPAMNSKSKTRAEKCHQRQPSSSPAMNGSASSKSNT